jgi:uncharacterized protein YdaU (DUF1376 family)
MAALPYMQFYVADYLADTMHLSTEEHGAYLLLIMNYWRRGKPLDGRNGRLASVVRMSNERWDSVEHTLREFFVVDEDGQWVHPRIEEELEKAQDRIDAAARAGRASAKARGNKRSTPVQRSSNGRSTPVDDPLQRKGNHSEPEPSSDKDKNPPNPPGGGFDEFWQAYPKPVGKGAAEKSWKKLSEPDRAAVMQDLRHRPGSDPQWLKDGGQFIPNPSTYLNQKRWLDDWQLARASPYSETTRQNIANLREWVNGS